MINQKIKNLLRKTFLINIYRSFKEKRQQRVNEKKYKDDLAIFRLSSESVEKRFTEYFDYYPIFDENTINTDFEPHYTYHPAWAARILAETKPIKHIDISSVLHFSTLVSAFIPVDFFDYRPAEILLDGLSTKHADLTNLPFQNNSIASLSCMHTIEHIGLGRYGDEIDYDGDLKAIAELKRVVAPNGNLIIVTPVGKPKISFNAHRIYSAGQLISYFSDFELLEFSLVPDNYKSTGLIRNAAVETADKQDWGCGCFWFKKPGI